MKHNENQRAMAMRTAARRARPDLFEIAQQRPDKELLWVAVGAGALALLRWSAKWWIPAALAVVGR